MLMANATKCKSGELSIYQTTKENITIHHGLGETPDFVFAFATQEPAERTQNLESWGFFAFLNGSDWKIVTIQYPNTTNTSPTLVWMTNATLLNNWVNSLTGSECLFARAATSYYVESGFSYKWVVGKY